MNEDILEAIPQIQSSNSGPSSQIQQTPQQQEQEDDLLGGILSDLTISDKNNKNNNNKNNNNNNNNDFFDVFNDNNDNNNNNNNLSYLDHGPSLKLCLTSNNAEGLEISVGYKRSNQQPIMVVQASNKGNVIISRIDLKFNKNYLGIQPTQTLPLQGNLNPGTTQKCELPLDINGEMTNVTPVSYEVQMAVRSTRNGVAKPPVHVFSDDVPPEIFFSDNGNVDKSDFTQLWKNIADNDMQVFQSKQIKDKDHEWVKDTLTAKNFFFIAPREIPGKGMSLYFSSNIKNTIVLSEISIAISGACRIAVKSENKWFASVTCHLLSKELV